MATGNVNLLHPAAGGSLESTEMAAHIRLIGWITMSIFLVAGIIGFVAYILLGASISSLSREQRTATNQVQGLTRVEGLHVLIASRLSIIDNILQTQTDYNKRLDLVEQISPESGITRISLEDGGVVRLGLTTRTIPEAQTLVEALFQMSLARTIRNAVLDTLALTPEGNMNISMSFEPILNQ